MFNTKNRVMININLIQVVEVLWHGPFDIRKIASGDEEIYSKNGLYQICGTHPVLNKEMYLYIGKTVNPFKLRMREHYHWLKYEHETMYVHLGELMKPQYFPNDAIDQQETSLLHNIESLLIYYCAPPYNSHSLIDLKQKIEDIDKHLLVLNIGKRKFLPYEVSTLWYHAESWNLIK